MDALTRAGANPDLVDVNQGAGVVGSAVGSGGGGATASLMMR